MGIQTDKELSVTGRAQALRIQECSPSAMEIIPRPQAARAGFSLPDKTYEVQSYHASTTAINKVLTPYRPEDDLIRRNSFENSHALNSADFASKIAKHDYFLSPHMNVYFEEALPCPRIPLAPIPILPSNIPQSVTLSSPSKSSAFKRFMPSKNKSTMGESSLSNQTGNTLNPTSRNITYQTVDRSLNVSVPISPLNSSFKGPTKVKCEESMAPLESSRVRSGSAESSFTVSESPNSSHGGSNESSITKHASLSSLSANHGMPSSPWKNKSHMNGKVSSLAPILPNPHTPFFVSFPPETVVSESEESSFSQGTDKNSESGFTEGCKKCSCKKSQCLKLYCECFRSSVYCSGSCKCVDCMNNAQHERTVQEARRSVWARNALAFTPRIVFSSPLSPSPSSKAITPISSQPHHRNGCNCRKSMCTKKYCECFQAGTACTKSCRCHESCKNPYGGCMGSMSATIPSTPHGENASNCLNLHENVFKEIASFCTNSAFSPPTPHIAQEKRDSFPHSEKSTAENVSPDFYLRKRALDDLDRSFTSSTLHSHLSMHEQSMLNPLMLITNHAHASVHSQHEQSNDIASLTRMKEMEGKKEMSEVNDHAIASMNEVTVVKNGHGGLNGVEEGQHRSSEYGLVVNKDKIGNKNKISSDANIRSCDASIDSFELLRILLLDINSWQFFDKLGEHKSYLFDFVANMHATNPEEIKICQQIIFAHNLNRQELTSFPPSVLHLIFLIFNAKKLLLHSKLETMVDEIMSSTHWKALSHKIECHVMHKPHTERRNHVEESNQSQDESRVETVVKNVNGKEKEKRDSLNVLHPFDACDSTFDDKLVMVSRKEEEGSKCMQYVCTEGQNLERFGRSMERLSTENNVITSPSPSEFSHHNVQNVRLEENHNASHYKSAIPKPLLQDRCEDVESFRDENSKKDMNRREALKEDGKESEKGNGGFGSKSAKAMADVYNDVLKQSLASLQDVKNESDVLYQKQILRDLLSKIMAIESCD